MQEYANIQQRKKMVNPLRGFRIWFSFQIVLFLCIVAEVVFVFLLTSKSFIPENDLFQNVGSNQQFYSTNNSFTDSNTKTTNFYQETTIPVRKPIIVWYHSIILSLKTIIMIDYHKLAIIVWHFIGFKWSSCRNR